MGTDEQDLLTEEGVNEGSKDAAAESSDDAAPTGAHGAAPAASGPTSESDPAPPDDMGTADSRAVTDAGPGQQLQAGEG